jgi:hypothetical protein
MRARAVSTVIVPLLMPSRFALLASGKQIDAFATEAISPGLKAVAPIRVQASQVQGDLELKAIPVTDSVIVTADQDKPSNPALSETIAAKTLREAPNVNERFESSLPLIPGVVRGPDGHISLKGTRNTRSGALVNSANLTSPGTGGPAIKFDVVSFARFSSFDLQIARPARLHVGEKRPHARVGASVFNLFNHFNPRYVQNNFASARFGQFSNNWGEYCGKFVLES